MSASPSIVLEAAVEVADKVRFLSRPESYPEPVTSVQVMETHMSWVFLTDTTVYKMKKPSRLPFLDFSTLERRWHFCTESLRLNRRLAPDVYLDVVPLVVDGSGALHLGGEGRAVEWLEKMRRLPRERMLDAAIVRGAVTAADVGRIARVLARFYRQAPPEPVRPEEFRARLMAAIDDNEQVLRSDAALNRSQLARVAAVQRIFVERRVPLLDARLAAGRIIEGHGDLRPEHVCLLDEPVFIDCLEFNRDFRIVDVADELSYLAMECEFLGAAFVGPRLLECYTRETGDRIPVPLVAFYQSFRALMRAKLALWHLPDYPPETHPHWRAQAAGYLDLADRRLTRFL